MAYKRILAGVVAAAGVVFGEEPALPAGLGVAGVPTNSVQAGEGAPTNINALVSEAASTNAVAAAQSASDVTGFWEVRGGLRTQNDPHEKAASIGEARLHVKATNEGKEDEATINLAADFLFDPVLNDHRINLDDGEGWIDLREANVLMHLSPSVDMQLGRQINTWGTGDLLFINDLFPKDWNAFFIGRDDEYLKAPSDSLKTSVYGDWANLDVIYSPGFDSDRYIDGRRLSFWNSGAGQLTGRNAEVDADKPDNVFKDDEWATRLYRSVGSYELAAYGYYGFWKSPAGLDPATGHATFPRLQVLGASARGPLGPGILSAEGGWYRSADDLDGDDPYVRNSEARYLVGYEQELLRDLTGGVQYYVENMLDYDAYQRAQPDGMRIADEYRQVVTVRLTKLLMSQNLRVGVFVYYSPTDRDTYLRPNVNYKLDDEWTLEAGGNIFLGERDDTFFGQFERNNNVYVSARCWL